MKLGLRKVGIYLGSNWAGFEFLEKKMCGFGELC